jgi:hypothetical protein
LLARVCDITFTADTSRYDWPHIHAKGRAMSLAIRFALVLLILTGCEGNLDSVMWDCQLEVQKGNAGKSAEAAEERGHAIEACMRARGYRLDAGKPSCRQGAVNSTCYRKL